MNTSQPPVPISLRCLAVLPAIIMLGGYALLGPTPVENDRMTFGSAAVPSSVAHETIVEDLPPVGEKLAMAASAELLDLR
jgi:hypothetical protein